MLFRYITTNFLFLIFLPTSVAGLDKFDQCAVFRGGEHYLIDIKVPDVPASRLVITAKGGTIKYDKKDNWIASSDDAAEDFIVSVAVKINGKTKILASKAYEVLPIAANIFPKEKKEWLAERVNTLS